MSKKIDEYLLKKYSIPPMGDYSQPGSVLCGILYRLTKNKKLDDIDKKWIRDKGMDRFYQFLERWEETGKPNYYTLHESYFFPHKSYMPPREVHTVSRRRLPVAHLNYSSPLESHTSSQIETTIDNKSRQNNSNPINKQSKDNNLGMNIRKSHMALYYKQKTLKNHIESNIAGIVPSDIPEDISSLVPEKIWDTMHKSIQKDVQESYNVYRYQQWTATSLMAYRLLENVLRIHVKYDLKEEGTINNIGDAIKILKKQKYDDTLLKELREYQEKRNEFMHGHIRAGAGEVKKLISDIMSITLNIHNIKP